MQNNTGNMAIENEWQDALAYIQGRVPKQVYDTWFTPIYLERIEDSTAQLGVPNKFFGDWLHQHYGSLLSEAVSAARGGVETSITFVIFKQAKKQPDSSGNTVSDRPSKRRATDKTRHSAQPKIYVQKFCRRRGKPICPCRLYGGRRAAGKSV